MKKVLLGFLFLSLFSTVFLISFINFNSGPVSSDKSVNQFVINQGEGINQISSRLAKNQLIKNKYVFLYHAYKLGLSNRLQAGLFKLSPSLGTVEIVKKLTQGGNHDYWLKILGGQRLAEIEPKFENSLEGYIYPDSYLIPADYTTEQILTIISTNFRKKYDQAFIDSTTSLSESQIIILASLIEREARTLESKRMVSGILHNRLKINMALQVDATAQYVRDTKTKPVKYWLPAGKNDLSLVSPYNTYQQPGLPPGPICNPGYDSLYAAMHPIMSDYIFYITGNDNKMHYATTLEEHNENIAKYLK